MGKEGLKKAENLSDSIQLTQYEVGRFGGL